MLEPLIIGIELHCSSGVIVALNLQLMLSCQVSLGSDMGEKMRDVSEFGLLWADTAIEH